MEYIEPIAVTHDNVEHYIKLFESGIDLKPHVRQMIKLCMYSYRNKPNIAQYWMGKTLEVAKQCNDNRFIAAALVQFGNYYLTIGNFQFAKNYYSKSIKPMDGNQSGLAMVHESLALIAHHQSDYEACMANFKIAFKHLKNINASPLQYYGLKSNYAAALSIFGIYDESLKIRLETIANLNENDPNHFNLLAFAYQGLAVIYIFLNKPKKALTYSKLNLNLRKKQSNEFKLSTAHLELANVYEKNQQDDLAVKEIKEAIVLCEKLNNNINLGSCYLQLALMAFKKLELKKALQHINKAIGLHEKTDYEAAMVSMYLLKTEINLKNDDLNAAQVSISKAFEHLKNNKVLADSKKANYLMCVIKTKTGDYKAALYYANKEKEFTEKITKKENSRIIANMEAKYEKSESEKEAQQLKLEKVTFQQKALRAQMNPHFIFNSLNSIQSYISLNETKVASIYLASFSKLMRQILENSNEEFVPLEKVVIFLKEYLRLEQMRFKHSFTYQISIDDEVEEDIMQIPSMIIQPFVENAILHGINDTEEGRIEIEFKMENDNTILCVVDDNGVGVNEAKKNKAEKQHKSMGTQITADRIKALTSKHKGKLKTKTIDKSKMGLQGTQVKIFLPIFISHNGNP